MATLEARCLAGLHGGLQDLHTASSHEQADCIHGLYGYIVSRYVLCSRCRDFQADFTSMHRNACWSLHRPDDHPQQLILSGNI